MRRGPRTQAAADSPEETGEELQSPSIFLEAETTAITSPALLGLPRRERCLCIWANLSLLAAPVITWLPGGKISHTMHYLEYNYGQLR